MVKKHPYTCPRCHFFTAKKSNMQAHLYDLKKSCPASTVDIELTDAIKKYILDNRVYHPPKQTQQQIINQQININNIIVNYVNKMDFQDKLLHYLQYHDTELLQYHDAIETKYEQQVDRFEKKSTKGFHKFDTLTLDGLINVLHTCTTANDVQEMNVMYDKVLNRLHIYSGEWEPFMFKDGVKELIEKIQETYLDYYEEYLLRQYSAGSIFDKQCIKEALKEYYEFLECFDIDPRLTTSPEDWVQELSDDDIGRLYTKVKDELRASKLKEVRKTVYDVIKTNCTASVMELNKKIVDLIKMDEMFKNKLLMELQGAQP